MLLGADGDSHPADYQWDGAAYHQRLPQGSCPTIILAPIVLSKLISNLVSDNFDQVTVYEGEDLELECIAR